MISEKLQKAFNDQIAAEMWSSNLYLQMAFYLEKEGWDGCAHWMYKQSDEEKEHAVKMAKFMIDRGGTANLDKVDVVPQGWGSVKDVFENVYSHECKVSRLIDELLDVAVAENDKATQNFLWGFVEEQVEEESTASAILNKINKGGLHEVYHVDKELAARK